MATLSLEPHWVTSNCNFSSSASSSSRISWSARSGWRRQRVNLQTRSSMPDSQLDSRPALKAAIQQRLEHGCLLGSELQSRVAGVTELQQGKVRDLYVATAGSADSPAVKDHADVASSELLLAITSDRQSAFDRVLAAVPFKGQVLNQTSAWWFQQTAGIVPNAFLLAPDPNVTLFKKCTVFPVEFVVRGYITGTTSTSLWTVYNKGIRNYCGHSLPEGMRKNDKLERNIVTPTTKAKEGDVPVSPEEIVSLGLMSREDFLAVEQMALQLFEFGQRTAAQHGLILVDTKYEFGRDSSGNICLLDEIHTPDSSRYWLASSYEERHAAGHEPQNIDKEFLRLWFKDNCDPYNDEVLPSAPSELITELSWRYILLFELITGQQFSVPDLKVDMNDRIASNVAAALSLPLRS